MTKYSDLLTLFSSLDIRCEEYNIETNEEIYLPYMVYIATQSDSFGADGTNYINFLNVNLVYASETLDWATLEEIEKILITNEIRYTKEFEFDDDNRVYTTIYNFQVIDG